MDYFEELAIVELELADSERELEAAEQEAVVRSYLYGSKDRLDKAEERVRFYQAEIGRLREVISNLPEAYGSW
jgi:hypothetical protein